MARYAWIVGIPVGLLALVVGYLAGYATAERESLDRPDFDEGYGVGYDDGRRVGFGEGRAGG